MHDYPVILCEPFLHFLLPSGMMDKTDGRDRRMAQYYMLYKPRGLLTAKRDARRETVMSCFPEALREMLHPVGRLDRDTEGLLLFTDDGMLDVRFAPRGAAALAAGPRAAACAHEHRGKRAVSAGALPREIPEKPGPARHDW